MKRLVSIGAFAIVLLLPTTLLAGDLVRGVRFKLSAGDIYSGASAVENYRRENGIDKEYLNAIGWLARGAEMLGYAEIATAYVEQLREAIPEETDDLLTPYGAAIEVDARLRATRDGRGAALRYLSEELARAQATSLRSRISKNINLISLEGQIAPAIDAEAYIGPKPPSLESLEGEPVLLFLWAYWCGDCKAQYDSLARIWKRYEGQGLHLIAPTRLYDSVDGDAGARAEEMQQIEDVWKESYPDLNGVPIPVDTDVMVRYGASATPTFALIDRKGRIRFYTPTRLSEAELSKRIEDVLAES